MVMKLSKVGTQWESDENARNLHGLYWDCIVILSHNKDSTGLNIWVCPKD